MPNSVLYRSCLLVLRVCQTPPSPTARQARFHVTTGKPKPSRMERAANFVLPAMMAKGRVIGSATEGDRHQDLELRSIDCMT